MLLTLPPRRLSGNRSVTAGSSVLLFHRLVLSGGCKARSLRNVGQRGGGSSLPGNTKVSPNSSRRPRSRTVPAGDAILTVLGRLHAVQSACGIHHPQTTRLTIGPCAVQVGSGSTEEGDVQRPRWGGPVACLFLLQDR